jgi:hypothetical protein
MAANELPLHVLDTFPPGAIEDIGTVGERSPDFHQCCVRFCGAFVRAPFRFFRFFRGPKISELCR